MMRSSIGKKKSRVIIIIIIYKAFSNRINIDSENN